MSLLQSFLDHSGVVILDGALATELERRGADLRDPLWSAKILLEWPDLIRAVHRDYLEAGADVVTSASYQASFEGFARRGLAHTDATRALRLSVRLACEAREQFMATAPRTRSGPAPLVAASVGCYGAVLHDGSEYRGTYGLSGAQLRDWHRPRLEVLAGSGADLLACETIPCRPEAEALVRVLDEFPEMPAWLSFSCRDAEYVSHGDRFIDCVQVAADCLSVVAVGVNCTAPRWVEDLLKSIGQRTKKPLLAYPNSAERWDAERRCWCPDGPPVDWIAAARSWYAAGARLLGGCCRTTPATIRTLASVLKVG